MKALSMKISTMNTTQELMASLKGASSVMATVNENMDIQQIQQVLKEFNKESMKMEMGQEAMGDAMDMGMEDCDDEADEVYQGILGEIGMDY
jgi:charged multivesicular body protein 2A